MRVVRRPPLPIIFYCFLRWSELQGTVQQWSLQCPISVPVPYGHKLRQQGSKTLQLFYVAYSCATLELAVILRFILMRSCLLLESYKPLGGDGLQHRNKLNCEALLLR